MALRVVPVLFLVSACADVVVPLGGARPEPPFPTDPSVEPPAELYAMPLACGASRAGPLAFGDAELGAAAGGEGLVGGALFAADLDGDALVDLGAGGFSAARAFRNLGSSDRETLGFQPDACLDPFDLSRATSVTPVDHDGDGDLDLYATLANRAGVLLRNDADTGWLSFEDVTWAVGLGDVGPSLASAWADYDGDGDLDVFLGGLGQEPPRLLANDHGVFLDASDRLPDAALDGQVSAARWFDVDFDGLPELYLVRSDHDRVGNALIRNLGEGELVADHNELGLDVVGDGTGVAIGDVNGDQVPDLLISERGNLQLRLSRDGWWEEASHELGLRPDVARGQVDAWGVALGDVDNDGDLDAAVSFGPTFPTDEVLVQPDALFLQQADGTFVDVAPQLGLDHGGVGRGQVFADLNEDGWLDLVKRDLAGPSSVSVQGCGAERFLRISLEQPGPNHFGVGARIRVLAGGRVWVRTVGAGGDGFGSAGPPEIHVGLGGLESVDRVDVIWPDGRINRFEDVATGSRLWVVRAP